MQQFFYDHYLYVLAIVFVLLILLVIWEKKATSKNRTTTITIPDDDDETQEITELDIAEIFKDEKPENSEDAQEQQYLFHKERVEADEPIPATTDEVGMSGYLKVSDLETARAKKVAKKLPKAPKLEVKDLLLAPATPIPAPVLDPEATEKFNAIKKEALTMKAPSFDDIIKPNKPIKGAAVGKLEDDEVRTIYYSTESNTVLALQYDVSTATIRRIKNRETYLHVSI